MIIHNNTKKVVIYNTENTSVMQMHIDDEDRYGEYICRASNALGLKEIVYELREGDPPATPELAVTGEDQGIVKLSIKVNEDEDIDDDLKVTGFKVQYILASDSWNSPVSQEFKIGDTYELKNMSFNTEYIFRAAAHNAAGYGNFSEPVEYKTHSLQTASVISSASTMLAMSSALFFSMLLFALL